MPDDHDSANFVRQLLQQDIPPDDSAYQEYRMKLEQALTIAQRRETLAGRVAVVSLIVGVVLMFAAGSKVIGSIDPADAEATILSVSLGVVYWLAVIAGLISIASYYSRFRPRIREIRDQIRDTNILALQHEIAQLRKEISEFARHDQS
jgi:hypothetical protein